MEVWSLHFCIQILLEYLMAYSRILGFEGLLILIFEELNLIQT